MGELGTQIRLCMWKHLKLRLRQPIVTICQLFFPSLLILVLILFKSFMPPGEFETCQFRARTGPGAGPLSLLRSFACNIQNNCNEIEEFEDIPAYNGSKLDKIVEYIEPILYNDTVQNFAVNIPNILRIINGSSETLNNSIIMEKYVTKNVTLNDMLYDPAVVQEVFLEEGFDETTAKFILNAVVRMGMISGDIAALEQEMTTMNCSDIFSLILPATEKSITKVLSHHVCAIENAANFSRLMQENLNSVFLTEYFENPSSSDDSLKVMNSIATGFSILSEFGSLLDDSNFRKKREISELNDTVQSLLTNMMDIVNDVREKYDHKKIVCLIQKIQGNGNLIENMNTCNMTHMIAPLYQTLKVQIPVWVNVMDALSNQSKEKFKKFKDCKIDINQYIFSKNQDEPAKNDIVICSHLRKRETPDYTDLLLGIDIEIVKANLETWRKNAFESGNWTEEAKEKIVKMYKHVDDVIGMIEKIPKEDIDYLDPASVSMYFTSRGSLIMESLVAAVNETDFFFKNSDMWENYTQVVGQLDGARKKLSANIVIVKDITTNWTNIEKYLSSKVGMPAQGIDILQNEIVALQIINLILNDLNKDLIECDQNLFERYFYYDSGELPPDVEIKDVVGKLCSSKNILKVLLQQLKSSEVIDLVTASYSLNPDKLAQTSSLSRQEFDATFDSLNSIDKIYPTINESLSLFFNEINITEVKQKLNVSKLDDRSLPKLVNNFMCGEPLTPEVDVKYKPLEPISNDTSGNTPLNNSCQVIHEALIETWEGRVIWSYIYPILIGNIYIAPDVEIARKIKQNSQPFFDSIALFRSKFVNIGQLYDYLKETESYDSKAILLDTLFSSIFFKDFIHSKFGSKYNFTHSLPPSLTSTFEIISNQKSSLKLADKLSKALQCINTERLLISENENDILLKAKLDQNRFLAGIVLLDQNNATDRSKRDTLSQTPKSVQYKIRMEIDKVPQTSTIKERLWVPGPDGDFYYNMRYFWGFLQIQELVDNSLIEMWTDEKPNDEVLMQQFPYPCFLRDNYLSGIYTAQIIQVVLMFGFSVIVSTLVREYVWERESMNSQLLQVVGMRSAVIWTSNVFTMVMIFVTNALLLSLILSVGDILPKSRFEIIFMTLFTFSISLVAFVYMMSTILKKATSGSVTTFLVFIATFLPFLFIISLDDDVGSGIKFLTGFSMTSSFGFCLLYITRYEQQQIGISWENIDKSPMDGDTFTYLHFLFFLLADSVLYGLVGCIISKFSNIDGSWNSKKKPKEKLSKEEDFTEETDGIQLVGLTKEYRLNRRNKRIAVDKLDLVMRKHEITGILGHNGAGKSTTLSMLTGIVQPTEGNIIVNGKEFSDQWNEYRKLVGYCPQTGILYDNLNTEEHIYLYSSIKSKDSSSVEENVQMLLNKMGLKDKSKILSKHLSEGLRRRLSIALAFSGGTEIVILDEPTSGVDSSARRKIWDFITEWKDNKTIIISTHHMDEAEILCDKIAILHRGKVLSEGSTLQLQEKFGSGLQLNINQGVNSNNPTQVTSVCSSRISMTSISAISDQIDMHVNRIVPKAEKIVHSAQRRSYNLPIDDQVDYNKYHELFAVLENEKQLLEINTFSIASPNLEDVFMNMTNEEENNETDSIKTRQTKLLTSNQIGSVSDLSESDSSIETELLWTKRNQPNGASIIWSLIMKRYKRMLSDNKLIISKYAIPTILLTLALILGKLRPSTNSPPILLTPSMYGPKSISFLSDSENGFISSAFKNPPGIGTTCMSDFKSLVDYVSCSIDMQSNTTEETVLKTCECSDSNWKCSKGDSSYSVLHELTNTTDEVVTLPKGITPNKWILDKHYDYISKQFGGWKILENTSIVYFNNKGFHTPASYLNALNNARLRSSIKDVKQANEYGITTYNHPFRSTDNQVQGQSILQHVSDYSLALFIVTAVSFVPAGSIVILIQERLSEEKIVLKMFGVSSIKFWLANFIWDLMANLIFVCIAAILIKVFNVSSFSIGLNFIATLILFTMYCLTINSLIYLAEKMFHEPSYGQIIIITGCIFTGVITLLLMLLFYMYWWIKPLADARQMLSTVLLLLPPYALGGGLLNLLTNQISAELFQQFTNLDVSYNPFDWEITGKNLFFLGIEIVFFFMANLIYEYFLNREVDVQSQRSKEILKLANVRKVYTNNFKGYEAVKDVNINIQQGECYGLIGLNGAGKSTTFKMITGCIKPTSGSISFNCDRIGYCPQNNSLDEYITVKCHLNIYALIAGYSKDEIDAVTKEVLEKYSLLQYSSVPCGKLSGGNKRKLCTATAMLGRPDIILMDEPTSGMDPASRRLIWKNVGSAITKGQSVLLTSHSLIECDILCDTVSIISKGTIVCTDPPAVLREKFGRGYKINLKLHQDSSVEGVHIYVTGNFVNPKFIENKHNWIRYTVQGQISSILGLLAAAKSQAIIESFTIDVTSLEDIFLQITGMNQFEIDQFSKEDFRHDSNWMSEKEVIDEHIDNESEVPEAPHYDPPEEP